MYDITANRSCQIYAIRREITVAPSPSIVVMPKPVHARQRRTRARARRGRLRPPPRPVRELTRPDRVDPPAAKKAQKPR
jgi:hypothetical protein